VLRGFLCDEITDPVFGHQTRCRDAYGARLIAERNRPANGGSRAYPPFCTVADPSTVITRDAQISVIGAAHHLIRLCLCAP